MKTLEPTRTQTGGSQQDAQSPAELRKHRLRWWTLAVVSVTLVLETIDETILNVALPTLQQELGASASGLQWMVNSYILVFGGLLLIMGGLGDRFGRARMLQAGLVVFGLASLAAAYVDTTGQLIAARAVMGVGAAMMMPATLSIIVDVFKGKERAKAISIWASLAGIGLFLGPVLGGLLLRNFYWGSVFLVNVPIAALALVATFILVPDSRDPEAKPLDIPGAVLSAGAISALIYAIIEGPDQGWTSPPIWGSVVAAILLGIGFGIRETRTRYPLLDFAFFKRARFSTGAAAISLAFFAIAAMIFGLTQYLQFVQGYTPLEAGIRFLPASLGLMVGAIGSEMLAARYGTTKVVSGGMLLLAATMPLMLFWEVDTPYWVVGVVIAVVGFAAATIFAPSTEAVMGGGTRRESGHRVSHKRSNPADRHRSWHRSDRLGNELDLLQQGRRRGDHTARRSGRSGQRLGGSCAPDRRLAPRRLRRGAGRRRSRSVHRRLWPGDTHRRRRHAHRSPGGSQGHARPAGTAAQGKTKRSRRSGGTARPAARTRTRARARSRLSVANLAKRRAPGLPGALTCSDSARRIWAADHRP